MSIPGLDPIPIGEEIAPAGEAIKITSFSGKVFTVPEAHRYGTCRPVTEFERLSNIGEGAYGIVYKAKDKKKDEIVALKKLKVSSESGGIPIGFIREIQILKLLKHENIVNYLDIVAGRKLEDLFMVMEFCHYELSNVLDEWTLRERPFRPSEIKCIMLQLFSGLQYLHGNCVIHRDIKVSNILFTDTGCLKIADFGLARKQSEDPMTPHVVSRWYRAPEILFSSQNYTSAIDVWAAGCIFAELLLNKPLFPGKSDFDMIKKIITTLGNPNEEIWPGCSQLPAMSSYVFSHQPYNNLSNIFKCETAVCLSLVHGLFLYDPEKRISAKTCLHHQYFSEEPVACSWPILAERLALSKIY